jgi:hypothetical protein
LVWKIDYEPFLKGKDGFLRGLGEVWGFKVNFSLESLRIKCGPKNLKQKGGKKLCFIFYGIVQ